MLSKDDDFFNTDMYKRKNLQISINYKKKKLKFSNIGFEKLKIFKSGIQNRNRNIFNRF